MRRLVFILLVLLTFNSSFGQTRACVSLILTGNRNGTGIIKRCCCSCHYMLMVGYSATGTCRAGGGGQTGGTGPGGTNPPSPRTHNQNSNNGSKNSSKNKKK